MHVHIIMKLKEQTVKKMGGGGERERGGRGGEEGGAQKGSQFSKSHNTRTRGMANNMGGEV
jgi:hypothetical protein